MCLFFRIAVRPRGPHAGIRCICLQYSGIGTAFHSAVCDVGWRHCITRLADGWVGRCDLRRDAVDRGPELRSRDCPRCTAERDARGSQYGDSLAGECDELRPQHCDGPDRRTRGQCTEGHVVRLHMHLWVSLRSHVIGYRVNHRPRATAQHICYAIRSGVAGHLKHLLRAVQLVLLLRTGSGAAGGPLRAPHRKACSDGSALLRAPQAVPERDRCGWCVGQYFGARDL
mmetsp:Transcript_15599/g.37506  ORF Transcript_15599/g.37506 Transcript_15599/m.37506 type:complete len:228 (+) Transcript_15599:1467-2150(+)